MHTRRTALAVLGTAGIGTGVFQRALATKAADRPVSPQMVADAEWVAGIKLTDPQREAVVNAFKFARRTWNIFDRSSSAIRCFRGSGSCRSRVPRQFLIRAVTRSRQLRRRALIGFHGLTPTRIWRSVP